MANENLIESLESALLGIEAMDEEKELTSAHLHNALSLIHQSLGERSWVGLYLATPTRLILGPFQGTPACEKIAFGKGVVGECFDKKETITVFDVTKRPNYICCDASARSEICVYLTREGKPFGVFDIDLPYVHDYSKEEIKLFEKIAMSLIRFC